MGNTFMEINPESIRNNIFEMIGSKWMLISAGKTGSYNMMTASWGGMGVLWNKNVSFCFIRPGRYTYEFVENSDFFTLNFFDDSYHKILDYCGSRSGREINKMTIEGLTPVSKIKEAVHFQEARLVFGCRKIYFHDFNPSNFLVPDIQKNYPNLDYHRMYIGEIIYCLNKSN